MRQTWLEGLAEALAAKGKTKSLTILKTLIGREKQRRTFQAIRNFNGNRRSGSVQAVIAPDTVTGEWTEITEPSGIELACLEENERRF